MIKNPLKINKTLPKISSEKVINVWLIFYLKLASESVPKSIKNHPWLPYWSSLRPSEDNLDCPGAPFAPSVPPVDPKWFPTGSQKAPQTTIPSTYLLFTWIGPISLTPFWLICEGIYFRIRFWLDFVSILESEMDPKCNTIDSKSTIFLDGCCEWFFGVSSWRSRSFLEWPRLLRPSIFIGKHTVL